MKAMKTDLELSQKIVIDTAVLFNLARIWKDEGPEEDDDDDEEDDEEKVNLSPSRTLNVSIENRTFLENSRGLG